MAAQHIFTPARLVRPLAAAAAGALLLGLTLAASPASAADTPVTVTITGGSLSITVPAGTVSLGSRVNTVANGTITGPLGQVEVLDARGAGAGWVTSVISTALTPTGGGPTLPAEGIAYNAGTIAKGGSGAATFTANNPASMEGAAAAVTATAVTGSSSATWTPQITVSVPGGTVVGTYAGTVTHSVA